MFKKRLIAGLLAFNFAFIGLGPVFQKVSPVNISYAAEDDATKLKTQKEQLQIGVDDSVNIFASETYNLIKKQSLKANYVEALEYAKTLLNKEDPSYEELRNATIALNNAKSEIREYGKKILAVQKLKAAVEENRITIKAIKYLMNTYPAIAKSIGPKANAIIEKSNRVIANAQRIISQFE